MLMRHRRSGFTIVELLVVIVVLAILASITILVFNGVQERAQNSRFLAAFDAYEKGFRLYAIQNGRYPYSYTGDALGDTTGTDSTSGVATATSACLGENYPANAEMGAKQCVYLKSSNTILGYQNDSVNNALKTVMASLPDMDTKTKFNNGDEVMRGIRYSAGFSPTVSYEPNMQYTIKGNQSCARGVKVVQNSPDQTTLCQLKFPLP